jgi:site-specific recombinase XerD
MNSQQSDEYIYLRQIIVLVLAQSSCESIGHVLSVRRDEVSIQGGTVVIAKRTFDLSHFDFTRYLMLRDQHVPETDLLFPSKTGKQLSPSKFNEIMKHMIDDAESTGTMKKHQLSFEGKISTLQTMAFEKKRSSYQKTLAVALSCYLALRPSEIAKLKRLDFDFHNRVLTLRLTKGQEDQILPIPSDLFQPLLLYTSLLPTDNSYLFVNSIGNPWDRRDVHAVIRDRGIEKGLTIKVTPRRLRPSVIKQLISRKNTPESVLIKLLRHKDGRTLHTNYLCDLNDELSDTLDNFHPDQSDVGNLDHA